jgi:nitroreductase
VELQDAITQRRMVRRTSAEPLPVERVLTLLDLARRAPSAGFAQGQRFVVLTDVSRRAALAAAAGEDGYVARGFKPWLSVAPVHVVPCVDHRAYDDRYAAPDKHTDPDRWDVPYGWLDLGAAVQNLLLLATEAGLAAGFLGAHAVPGLAALLQLPDGVEAAGVIPLGHPHPDGARRSSSLARGRASLEDVVYLEGWGA